MEVAMGVLAEELPEVGFVKVPAEDLADVSMEYNVAAVPTFIFFRQVWPLHTKLIFFYWLFLFDEKPMFCLRSTSVTRDRGGQYPLLVSNSVSPALVSVVKGKSLFERLVFPIIALPFYYVTLKKGHNKVPI